MAKKSEKFERLNPEESRALAEKVENWAEVFTHTRDFTLFSGSVRDFIVILQRHHVTPGHEVEYDLNVYRKGIEVGYNWDRESENGEIKRLYGDVKPKVISCRDSWRKEYNDQREKYIAEARALLHEGK